MKEAIIGGIFALLGSVVTFLGTYLASINTKRDERNHQRIKNYLEEIKSFYNLEQLYINAIVNLREKLPEASSIRTPLGIQREFRGINEENGNYPITMTAKQADKMLLDME